MHSHDEFETGPDWRAGRRGARGAEWSGGPWPGADEEHEGPRGAPGRGWFGPPFGPGALGPWASVRGRGRGGRGWGRARRGDVRSAILVLLAERPMHGYEIIGELSDRTDGLWRPSPGSIYPTLQLLEDEGLVVAQADQGSGGAGKRSYALTEQGRQVADELRKEPAPWEEMTAGAPAAARALRHSIVKLVPAVRQVMIAAGPRECEEAAKVLDEARRRMYTILAADQSTAPPEGTGVASPPVSRATGAEAAESGSETPPQ